MVERADPSTVAVLGGDEDDVRRYIESDHKIRSGLCPNNCGLLNERDGLQECPKCHFATNVQAEKGAAS